MSSPGPRFVPLRVVDVIDETPDARSFVFEIPAGEREAFAYRAGQYCTFKISVGGIEQLRCYSMSSSPDVDELFRTTVKRVNDGVVSNAFNDDVSVGDLVMATPPAGLFCLDGDDDRPIVAFAGGSGITPVASIIKTALATTTRPVRLLFANRDAESVILGAELAALAQAHPKRFELVHHLDADGGFLSADAATAFFADATDATVYLCGPTPFMDLIEASLAAAGHDPARLRTERFVNASPVADDSTTIETADAPASITIKIRGSFHEIDYQTDETVLEAARRNGLQPPYSCQAGNCATCIAELTEGEVRMRVNAVLTPQELADGWILTCQSLPETPTLKVLYPD